MLWCKRAGRDSLPASAETVELYVTWMLDEAGRKTSTAERHVSAIAHFHRRAGATPPFGPGVREVIRAVRRSRKEKPVGKRALEVPDLVRAAQLCDIRTPLGARNRALIVLGFATSFRREELTNLQLADVKFERRGLAVLLRSSKRDQEGKGRVIGVWAGKRECTDPIRALRSWLRFRGEWAGPLFCRVQTAGLIVRRPISGEAVNEAVKKAISAAGIDPSRYGAHSLRAGAITASAKLGRSDQEIMGLSGHESAKVMRTYVRGARLFSGRNPLAGVL